MDDTWDYERELLYKRTAMIVIRSAIRGRLTPELFDKAWHYAERACELYDERKRG